MKPRNPEFVTEIRVFVRAKDTQAATQFANAINTMIANEVAGNFLKYRVSLTGNSVTVVENLED